MVDIFVCLTSLNAQLTYLLFLKTAQTRSKLYPALFTYLTTCMIICLTNRYCELWVQNVLQGLGLLFLARFISEFIAQ
jgi:hypothetical protein